jgi:pimeloyl-ACP methyl ester carboxylesterase
MHQAGNGKSVWDGGCNSLQGWSIHAFLWLQGLASACKHPEGKSDPSETEGLVELQSRQILQGEAEADIPIWKEALFGAELLLLHASPVYYGLGIPRGDGAAVIVFPGFLGSDVYMSDMRTWLSRLGYRTYASGIGLNADCPNLLIRYRVAEILAKARTATRRRVHLIGHSLGGVIARSIAAQRPNDVASVTTLGAPFRGNVAHISVLKAAKAVRATILSEHGEAVMPDCYTPRCTCDFLNSLRHELPRSMPQTAIYTRDDGIVDWRYCRTGDHDCDFEVPGTHIGLVFNASAYSVIARRLSENPAKR